MKVMNPFFQFYNYFTISLNIDEGYEWYKIS